MSFAMWEEERGPVTAIGLAGELDMASAPQLQGRVNELIAVGRCRILLDLAELTFCDSAGLNAFILGDRHCAAGGGWLRLSRPRGHVARVVALSGIDEVLVHRDET